MPVQAGTQIAQGCLPRRFAGGDGDIDRRQGVLVQAEGFSCETFDAIAGDRGAKGTGRYAQSQARMGFMIGQDG